MNTTHLAITLSLITSTAYTHAAPASWIVCNHNLELTETKVVKANEHTLTTVDSFGIERTQSTKDILFAIPVNPTPPVYEEPINPPIDTPIDPPLQEKNQTPPSLYITLTDGQRIMGTPLDSTDPDRLELMISTGAPAQAQSSIDLEHIRTLSTTLNNTAHPVNIDADSILTTNSDILVGFIEAVGLTTTIATDRNTINLKLNQIQSMRFANPLTPTPGIYISTNTNLHLRASSFDFDFLSPMTIEIDPKSLGLESDSYSTWLLPPDAPAGITINHPNQRVISLTSITPLLIKPTGDRSWTPKPTISDHHSNQVLASIDLHAPVRVIYPLPKGSTRIAFELSAAISQWTDCIASVHSISTTGQRTHILTQRLNAEHPSESINTPLSPDIDKIEIRIDPGEFGPIQDRVIIKHPRVLIES